MSGENHDERSDVPLGELPTDVLWRMALDGTIEFVSSEVYEVRGISAEEAKAQNAGANPYSGIGDEFSCLFAGTR